MFKMVFKKVFKKRIFLAVLISLFTYVFFFYPVLFNKNVFIGGVDPYRVFYPLRNYLYEELTSGRFPFYTERIFSGFPIYADLAGGYLNPVNVLSVLIFGPFTSYKILHLFAYLFGSLGLYAFLKRRGVDLFGYFISNTAYFFTFFSLYQQQHFDITIAYYLFPLTFFLIEKYLEKRNLRYIFLHALVLSFCFYAGSIQTFLLITISNLIYLGVFLWPNIRKWCNYNFKLLYIFLIFSLPLLVPAYNLYKLSYRSETGITYAEGSYIPSMLINIAYPFFMGEGTNYKWDMVNKEYLVHETYAYVGVSVLILAIYGFIKIKDKRLKWFLYLQILVFIFLGFLGSLPVVKAINLPIISMFRYWGRSVMLLVFSFSVLVSRPEIFDKAEKVKRLNIKLLFLPILYLMFLQLISLTGPRTALVFSIVVGGGFRPDVNTFIWLVFLLLSVFAIFLLQRIEKRVFLKILICVLVISDLWFFGKRPLEGYFRTYESLIPQSVNISGNLNKERVLVQNASSAYELNLYSKNYGLLGYSQFEPDSYDKFMAKLGFDNIKLSDNSLYNGKALASIIESNIGATALFTPEVFLISTEVDRKYLPFFVPGNYNLSYIQKDEGRIKVIIKTGRALEIKTYVRNFPEWQAFVNGVVTPFTNEKDSVFLSFRVALGESKVELVYIPKNLYLGFLGSVMLTFMLIFRNELSRILKNVRTGKNLLVAHR